MCSHAVVSLFPPQAKEKSGFETKLPIGVYVCWLSLCVAL